MAREKQEQQQQHVVAVPLPVPGHLSPLMRFCKLLAKQQSGIIITASDAADAPPLAQEHHNPYPAITPTPTAAPHSLARHIRLPLRGIDLSNDFKLSLLEAYNALVSISPHLEQLLLSLSRHGPPVTCLLSDFNIMFPTQDVADKLGIPRIVLYPCCASRLLFTHYLTLGELYPQKGISVCKVKFAFAVLEVSRTLK
ncbi:hypothetical protein GOP47_0002805 [Adiantum capillus-veneris]|uniref:Uncharacterized protein n=1 Tax=Adiantum capillus-veneris TaxID=13818 RepID=A0A9D4ZRM3_ADICA|nr:hypothetical protein GOP47_0002805 [Adiantum capillus-veneris]